MNGTQSRIIFLMSKTGRKADNIFMLKKNLSFINIALLLCSLAVLLLLFMSGKNQITKERVFDCGLPVMFIETDGEKKIRSKEKYIDADFSIFENYDSYIDGNGTKYRGKIRGRGNTTWTFRKKPYFAKFNIRGGVLGMSAAQKWTIRPFMTDKSKVRDAYATFVASTIYTNTSGGWIPSFKFVNLYLNNNFSGLYCIYEKVEQSENRINLPKDSFLFVVNSRLNKEWNFRSKQDVPFSLVDNDVPEEKFLKEKEILQSIEDQIFLQDNSKVFDFIDKASFVDWYILSEFSKNRDSDFMASCFMAFNSETKKLYMGPVWDFDIAFGGSHMDNNFSPEDSWINKFHWYKELWRNDEFKAAVKKRWNETKSRLKDSFGYVLEESKVLAPSAEIDDLVWQTLGRKQWPHTPGYKSRKTYQAEVDYVYNWLFKRYDWLDLYINSL